MRLVPISIHSLRVEGDAGGDTAQTAFFISIHSLRVEGDLDTVSKIADHVQFQSTPSVWRETGKDLTPTKHAVISIHSLRVEGDRHSAQIRARAAHFNPLPPCGGRPSRTRANHTLTAFQSTPSVWRETNTSNNCNCHVKISIHSLRVEGDIVQQAVRQNCTTDFNPLPPCGGRQQAVRQNCTTGTISIHSLRVEGDTHDGRSCVQCDISIHSLRVEGDLESYAFAQCRLISIHSLRVEGDLLNRQVVADQQLFQSTPSVWRETYYILRGRRNHHYFNPLPPCGGRHLYHLPKSRRHGISIHSLRVEGDSSAPCFCTMRTISIHSLRVEGDLVNSISPINSCHISIHSLRVEGDPPDFASLFSGSISIHSLRVEGDCRFLSCCYIQYISIHSLRVEGDPKTTKNGKQNLGISIHSLRVEGDYIHLMMKLSLMNFNPLPPCGGRLFMVATAVTDRRFQSTPSVWRETGAVEGFRCVRIDFNPLPPCGGRLMPIIRPEVG